MYEAGSCGDLSEESLLLVVVGSEEDEADDDVAAVASRYATRTVEAVSDGLVMTLVCGLLPCSIYSI